MVISIGGATAGKPNTLQKGEPPEQLVKQYETGKLKQVLIRSYTGSYGSKVSAVNAAKSCEWCSRITGSDFAEVKIMPEYIYLGIINILY